MTKIRTELDFLIPTPRSTYYQTFFPPYRLQGNFKQLQLQTELSFGNY